MTSYTLPRVRFADADGVSIACEVRGDGPRDPVRVSGAASSVLAAHLDPVGEAHDDRLASFSRLISFDPRGTGLSDPLLAGGAPPLEQRVFDAVAVMDAVGSRNACLYSSVGDGGQVAIVFAATHPEGVDALVLASAWTRYCRWVGPVPLIWMF
jgi:pimeloyl-ACP methyl ester carboxylesterase